MEIVGEPLEAKRLYDAVNVMLSLLVKAFSLCNWKIWFFSSLDQPFDDFLQLDSW